MTDSRSGSMRGLASRRGDTSANGSIRCLSGVFLRSDDCTPPQHRLRSADSRFSLNEQFAITRREYDFGNFDDGRSTVAGSVEDGLAEGLEASLLEDNDEEGVRSRRGIEASAGEITTASRNHYELLCVARDATDVHVRRAFLRLMQLLLPLKRGNAANRSVREAAAYLRAAQEAYETLVEPWRRLQYDLALSADESDEDEKEEVGEVLWASDDHDAVRDEKSHMVRMKEQVLNLAQEELQTITDMDLQLRLRGALEVRPRRLRGSSGRRSRSRTSIPLKLDPVGVSLRQSMTVSLPYVRQLLNSAALVVRGPSQSHKKAGLRFADPTLTIMGYAHGALNHEGQESRNPGTWWPLVFDALPTFGRYLPQNGLFWPGLGLKFRQEVWIRGKRVAGSGQPYSTPDTVVEQDVVLSSQPPSTITGAAHTFPFADPLSDEPVTVEMFAQTPLHYSLQPPRLGFAVHRRIGLGTAFVVLDSGDWSSCASAKCETLPRLEKEYPIKKSLALLQPALPHFLPPSFEVGFCCNRHAYDLGLPAGRSFSASTHRRDFDADRQSAGSWAVSLGVGGLHTLGCAFRFGTDVFTALSRADKQSLGLPPGNRAHATGLGGLRVEFEVDGTAAAAAPCARSVSLAVRLFRRAGRFSRLGLELGVGTFGTSASGSHVHLALCFSRLGQRIRLPVLLGDLSLLVPAPNAAALRLCSLAALPFIISAVLEGPGRNQWRTWRSWWRQLWHKLFSSSSVTPNTRRLKHPPSSSLSVSLRRAEADRLTALLAPSVQKDHDEDGLVILSAKYAEPGAAMEDVADVTVAVAALVGESTVLIPGGLRKSRLLGFWDPAPGRKKVLAIRYLRDGRERVVEVDGDEEVRVV